MAKELTQYIEDMLDSGRIKAKFVLEINSIDLSDYLVSWSIEASKEFASQSATFTLLNDGRFNEDGENEINVGDVIEFSEYFGTDATEFPRFYGIVNQRTINKTSKDRTISLVCLDYISVLQFWDINLEMDGIKVEVTNETLTPNFLEEPNAELAQIFNFVNDAISPNPPPIITIRNKDTALDDPQYDGFCYDKETEVLTEDGWKLLKDIVENKQKIKVATLNPEKNTVKYHYPSQYFQFKYKGKMFYQKDKKIDLLVTPNHKLWIGNSKGNNFTFCEAQKSNRYVTYKKDFPYNGIEQEYFILPEYNSTYKNGNYIDKLNRKCPPYIQTRKFIKRKIKMDDWLEFFGIWLAEGWISKAKKDSKYCFVCICQNEGEKFEKIKNIISKITDNFDIQGSKNKTIRFCDVQLAQYLSQFGHSQNKFISRELLNLSKRQLKLLFDALMLGDGTKNKKTGQQTYTTSSPKLAGNVQELILKLGYNSSVNKRKNVSCYDVSLINNIKPCKVNYQIDNRKFINYNDYVYCLEVPNHLLYVRRNGKSVWCGNSVLYDNGQLKLGFPLNAKDNYDLVCKSYWFYTKGLYVEDILEELFTTVDGYGNYLFGESTAQDVIDNHLTETFSNVLGSVGDTLTPALTSETITIETTLSNDVTAGDTSIVIDSTEGLPESGEGSINGDVFTWTSIDSNNTLSGIPATGSYSLKDHPSGAYVQYEETYAIGKVWYLSYSNLITDLNTGDFTVPGADIDYIDKRYGRIILDTAISLSEEVTCDVDYSFNTLQATGIELNQISFRSREVENRLDAIQKLRNYVAPNYVIRTLGDKKIWASYLSQKSTADYTLQLSTSVEKTEDEDLYSRVLFYGKNVNPTNLVLGGGADFTTTGQTYTAIATNCELGLLREEGNYYIYSSGIGNTITSDGKQIISSYGRSACNDATLGTGVWSNPSEATYDDGVFASALMIGLNTQYLKVTDFGFQLPSNVEIIGISVGIKRKGSNLLGVYSGITDNSIRLVVNGNIVGNNKAKTDVWKENVVAYEFYGGSSDMWGLNLSPSDINSNFGVVMSFTAGMAKAYVDSVCVMIHLANQVQAYGNYNVGKITSDIIKPIVHVNNIPIDNKSHRIVAQKVSVITTTRTETTSSSRGKCLPEGTLIDMADGTVKPIHLVSLGDKVKGGKVLHTSFTAHPTKQKLYEFIFDKNRKVISTYYHPFAEKPIKIKDFRYKINITYDFETTSGYYYVNGVKTLSTLSDGYNPKNISYCKYNWLRKLILLFNKIYYCDRCHSGVFKCKCGGGGGTSVSSHTYYYYKIKFPHNNIEPSESIIFYDAVGQLIYTLPPYYDYMNYGEGVLSVPGNNQNSTVEEVSTATYHVFYSSDDLVIDYEKAEFQLSKNLIKYPGQTNVKATFEYFSVVTPIKDVASVTDGRWDTQVQTEFFAEPPTGYNYAILDLGSIKDIQAIDMVAGFFKPDKYRSYDIEFTGTLHYSKDGTNYYEISDKTRNFKLSGGQAIQFEEQDLGIGFQARYLKLILNNVKKLEYGKGVWVVAITELALYDDIILKSDVTLISTSYLTEGVTNASTTVKVVSTEGFDSSGTAYLDYEDGTFDNFSYTGLTSTTFTGVSGITSPHLTGTMVVQDVEDDDTYYDYNGLLPKLGDRVFKQAKIDDNILFNQTQLDRLAKAYLKEFVKDHNKITVDVLYSPHIQVGTTIRVVEPFTGIDRNYFVESVTETDNMYNLLLAYYPA
jgi:hypothetical protein